MEYLKAGYIIKNGDAVLASSENLLTTAGKRIMASFMAGLTGRWAGAIAVGASGASVGATGTRLNYEWGRVEIDSSAVSYGQGATGSHRLIFKGTLDSSYSGKIYELGVFPQLINAGAGVGQSQNIAFGGSDDPWQEYVTGTGWTTISTAFDTTVNRVGSDAALLTAAASTQKRYRISGISVDLSTYSTADLINFAFQNNTNNPTVLNILMATDDSNYFISSVTPATWLGTVGSYKSNTLTKANFTTVGSPDWASITSIEFQITAPGGGAVNLYLDGIRIEDTDTLNPDFALISHSVLASPVTKVAGTMLDVEYYVDVPS